MAVMQTLASTREVFENTSCEFLCSVYKTSIFLYHFLTIVTLSLSDVPMESGDEENEEAIRNKELEIMELGEKYKKENRPQELAQLIRDVRPFLTMISKAKAAKLVRALVDLFLDMEASTGNEVQLCKVL